MTLAPWIDDPSQNWNIALSIEKYPITVLGHLLVIWTYSMDYFSYVYSGTPNREVTCWLRSQALERAIYWHQWLHLNMIMRDRKSVHCRYEFLSSKFAILNQDRLNISTTYYDELLIWSSYYWAGIWSWRMSVSEIWKFTYLAQKWSMNLGLRRSIIFLLNQISRSLSYLAIYPEIPEQFGEKFRHKNRQLIIRALQCV